ncbi:hypothetical protein FHX15_004884 [Rhizobium sp. BK650]|nr:hypothetical protein [Rhizobium sp. BK650]
MAFVAENPSPTPPRKGEGLQRGSLAILRYVFAYGTVGGEMLMARQASPPLWGGVGAGTSFPRGGST